MLRRILVLIKSLLRVCSFPILEFVVAWLIIFTAKSWEVFFGLALLNNSLYSLIAAVSLYSGLLMITKLIKVNLSKIIEVLIGLVALLIGFYLHMTLPNII